MRVGQRDVDRLQRYRVGHFAPVCGHHIGGGGQTGGAPKLGHHLAPREHALGAAGVFGIGQHLVFVAA